MGYITLLLVALMTGHAWAVPTGRSHFLSHGPGAMEQSLGEAVAGVVSGPSSLYYNAAGLSNGGAAMTGEWTRLLPGVNYSWFGGSFDLGIAHMGLGAISLDLGEITARSSLGDSGTTVSSYQRAYLIGSSREVWPGIFAGSTWGFLDLNLAGYGSKAFFMDLGAIYRAPTLWSAGLAVKNAYFSGLDFGGEKEVYPREIRAGVSLQKSGMSLVAQIDKALDGSSPAFSIGGGYLLFRVLSFRAGMNGYPRLGAGFMTKNGMFSLDMSYQVGAVSASQRLTATYFFRGADDEDRPKDVYTELLEQVESLEAYLSEESKRLMEQKRNEEAVDSLERLLALRPSDSDAALALKALTGRVYPTIGKPNWPFGFIGGRKKRLYLTFAVAFAGKDGLRACQSAKEFGERWPGDARWTLMAILVSGKDCRGVSGEERD